MALGGLTNIFQAEKIPISKYVALFVTFRTYENTLKTLEQQVHFLKLLKN